MGNKSFSTISTEECSEAGTLIFQHSNNKWKSATELAKLGDYGGATSLAIISVEELIKALILTLDSKGFEFRRIKGMKTIFNHHRIRYVIAYLMFALSLVGDDLNSLLLDFRTNPEKILALNHEMKSDKQFVERRMKRYFQRKLIIMLKEFEWFSQIDLFRQDGFYSDYKDQLKSPIQITKEEYDSIILKLGKVKSLGSGIIEAINDDFLERNSLRLNHIQRDFLQKGYYSQIGIALSHINTSRKDPFLFIREFLEAEDEEDLLTTIKRIKKE